MTCQLSHKADSLDQLQLASWAGLACCASMACCWHMQHCIPTADSAQLNCSMPAGAGTRVENGSTHGIMYPLLGPAANLTTYPVDNPTGACTFGAPQLSSPLLCTDHRLTRPTTSVTDIPWLSRSNCCTPSSLWPTVFASSCQQTAESVTVSHSCLRSP